MVMPMVSTSSSTTMIRLAQCAWCKGFLYVPYQQGPSELVIHDRCAAFLREWPVETFTPPAWVEGL